MTWVSSDSVKKKIIFWFPLMTNYFHISSVCITIPSSNNFSFNILCVYAISDLRYSDQWPVRRHDGQGEAAALVPEDDRRLPRHPLRQLHHQLEGWQTLQRRHTQTPVSVGNFNTKKKKTCHGELQENEIRQQF